MADLLELEIRTLVDEVDIGQVRAGLSVDSKVEAFSDERFVGAVVKIEPQAVVQQSVTTFPVLSRIDNPSGKLLPGMNADVSIIVHRKPGVLTIPNEAVRTPSDAAEVSRMLGLVGDESSISGGRGGGSEGEGRSGGASRGSRPADRSGSRGGDPTETTGGSDRGGRPDDSDRNSRTAGGDRSGGSDRGDSGSGSTGRGERGDSGRATSGGGEDMRARFENMSPAERQRMIAAMRVAAEAPDRDPFGIAGRREDGMVFVYDELGQISTKSIVVGVRDWENTEIIAGLDPGDQVLLLPSTSLLRSQDRLRSWAQGRSGIPGMGGGGGPPPGMGRGRGR
jgi:HlyD family secretion protein